jgi:hypothetical protein
MYSQWRVLSGKDFAWALEVEAKGTPAVSKVDGICERVKVVPKS